MILIHHQLCFQYTLEHWENIWRIQKKSVCMLKPSVSSDGKFIVTGCTTGKLFFIHKYHQCVVHTLQLDNDYINEAVWHPKSYKLLVGSDSHNVFIVG
mmetsp:Transcript_14769/g.16399  ORF Transcript_14769/g.16399 Transcript_14769/m.16399 type:complete len:98 (-) Transcript_14769:17-310(-)